ncbi:MAG: gluconate 5-dehydrogenase [Lachnospiraceae bacterium]|jgi:gluconate 5-dehydrogenase
MGVMEKFRIDGKVAWITGAAYGLGMAYAKALAEAGARIVFNCRSQEHLDHAMEEYKAAGVEAYGAIVDVTKEEEVKKFAADVKEKFGPITILFNNAGIIKRIPMTEMSLQEWNQVIDIDLTGPFICSKAVIPDMIEQGGGKIINACSMMSELGRETVSAYAAAKGGLKMLTKNICSEYGQYNIQCNGIGPGYIATPQTAPLRKPREDGSMNPFDRFIRSKTPAQRWGTTEDLMGLAVFLASPASDFINGQIVYIDGGILAYIGQDPSNLDESKFRGVKEEENIEVNDK